MTIFENARNAALAAIQARFRRHMHCTKLVIPVGRGVRFEPIEAALRSRTGRLDAADSRTTLDP